MAFRIKSTKEDAGLQKYRSNEYSHLRSAVLLTWWPPRKKAQNRQDEWLHPTDIRDNVNRILRDAAQLEWEISGVVVALYIDGYLQRNLEDEDGHMFRPTRRGSRMLETIRKSMVES